MPIPELQQARALLAAVIGRAGGLCVLTGAGMSAESGIPTFRDALTGYWSQFNPAELASEEGFRTNPRRVSRWYAERSSAVRKTQPNAGHHALAAFAQRHPGVMTLVTQNVDDLHQRAGNTDALALHGSILAQQWLDPCPRRAQGQAACDPAAAEPGEPPRCAECGNLVRPGVVWFGESLPRAAFEAAERAVSACTVMLVVGTSGAVWPAAGLAELARGSGAQVIIVNPAPSEIDDQAHIVLRGTAASVLPDLLAP